MVNKDNVCDLVGGGGGHTNLWVFSLDDTHSSNSSKLPARENLQFYSIIYTEKH